MVVSVDSVKVELLEDNTQKCSPSSSSKQNRQHKGKTRNVKKPTPQAKSDKNMSISSQSLKKDQTKLESNKNKDAVECKTAPTASTMINCSEASAANMEVVPGLVAGKGRTKKKKKEKNKNKKCIQVWKIPVK